MNTYLIGFIMYGSMITLITVSAVSAQTKPATPSATITQEISDSDVDTFKEKVAQKVTKMKGDTEKAKAGYISAIDDTTITIIDDDDVKSMIDLDSTLTQYYEVQGTVLKTIKKDGMKKDDYVFASGPEINGAIQANAVYRDVRFRTISGKISEVDKTNFIMKVVTQDKSNITLDVQTRTSQEMLDIKTLDINKVGFSKLKEGDSVHAVIKVTRDDKKQTRFDAEKLLIIPNEYFLQ